MCIVGTYRLAGLCQCTAHGIDPAVFLHDRHFELGKQRLPQRNGRRGITGGVHHAELADLGVVLKQQPDALHLACVELLHGKALKDRIRDRSQQLVSIPAVVGQHRAEHTLQSHVVEI